MVAFCLLITVNGAFCDYSTLMGLPILVLACSVTRTLNLLSRETSMFVT
jgi:hypothetical protein